MIKSNTIVLFIKVVPGGKKELEGGGTCTTRSNVNCATRAQKSKKLHHKDATK